MQKFKSLLRKIKEGTYALLSTLFKSKEFKQVLTSLTFKLLKLPILGGIQGWLIGFVVKHFVKEVIETINVVHDYIEIIDRSEDTIDMENRDEATDILNDIMR